MTQPEGRDRRLVDSTGGAVMGQELGRSDVSVTRFEADAQAVQQVPRGDVPATARWDANANPTANRGEVNANIRPSPRDFTSRPP